MLTEYEYKAAKEVAQGFEAKCYSKEDAYIYMTEKHMFSRLFILEVCLNMG